MEIKTIQNLFSMAAIKLTGNKISLHYSCRPNGFFNQSFEKEKIGNLHHLFLITEEIHLSEMNDGKETISLIIPEFNFNMKESVMLPTEKQLSNEEIKNIIAGKAVENGINDEEILKNRELITDYVHDWNDEYELIEQINNLFLHVSDHNKDKTPISINSYMHYEAFKEIGFKLMEKFSNIEIFAPEKNVPAVIHFSISAKNKFVFKKDIINLLCDALYISTSFEFTGDEQTEEIDFSFYL